MGSGFCFGIQASNKQKSPKYSQLTFLEGGEQGRVWGLRFGVMGEESSEISRLVQRPNFAPMGPNTTPTNPNQHLGILGNKFQF